MRIRVLRDFDHTPENDRRLTYALTLKPEATDNEITVKREVGEAAVAAGAAEEIDAPAREEPAPAAPTGGKDKPGSARSR